MSDEARHVAFGVLSLKEYYEGLTDAEMLERQEFAFEAAVRMRDRFLQQEVWERMGVDVRTMVKLQLEHEGDKNEDPFQQLLFSKIVPELQEARPARRQRRLAAQASSPSSASSSSRTGSTPARSTSSSTRSPRTAPPPRSA